MRIAAPFVALSLLLGCATTKAEAGLPAGGAPVPLTFAWPDGFQARVTLEHREQRSGAPPAQARASHRLVAERRGKAIWVSVRGIEAEGDVPDLELNVRISEALIQVVSPAGAYLRTEGLENALEILGVGGDEARDVARGALDRISALDWEITAGGWAGRAFSPGRKVSGQFPGSVPLIPGVPALLEVEQSLLGPVPCEEGEEAARCVKLSWRGAPSQAARQGALERLHREAGSEGPALEDLDGTVEATLVTEPATLVPHGLAVREELHLRVRQPGGDLLEVVERADDRYRFTPELEL
ncbi:MAG TPA: hypothetical protein VMK42_18415 [Anaeromyxobacteraceae bacterium]|nr:hypothetical protein [Anaeromyxobacteraceae bacterium]